MIVDAQIDVAIVEAAVSAARFFDDQGGTLLSAFISAARLRRAQSCDDPIGERTARLREGLGEREDERGDLLKARITILEPEFIIRDSCARVGTALAKGQKRAKPAGHTERS